MIKDGNSNNKIQVSKKNNLLGIFKDYDFFLGFLSYLIPDRFFEPYPIVLKSLLAGLLVLLFGKKQIQGLYERQYAKTRHKYIFVILIYFVFSVLIYLFQPKINFSYRFDSPDKSISQIFSNPEKDIESSCSAKFDFCDNFSNFEKYDQKELLSFGRDQENSRRIKSALPYNHKKIGKDNAILWVKDLGIPPEFKFEFKFKPLDPKKANVTINYGELFRCIIAESNYKTVTCEGAPNKKTKNNRSSRYISSIQPDTEILITGNTTIHDTNKLIISMIIEYTDIDNKPQSIPLNFDIVLSIIPETDKRKFGVGIIDPENVGIWIEMIRLGIGKK